MSTVKSTLIERIPVGNTLGEGIQWNAVRGEIWWTDIVEKQLYAYHWERHELKVFNPPEAICSFAFIQSEKKLLLVAFASGFAYYNPWTEEIDWLHKNVCDKTNQRLNDGRVDRQGRFWSGAMALHADAELAALYRVNQKTQLDTIENNIKISNGLCWSPNSKRMYFADSPRQEIYTYDFDALTGNIKNRQHFAHTPQDAYPDGANVDAEGYLWSAHWGAGKVVRYAQNGTIDTEINLPISQPTCIAFGGNDLSTLFVSSARQDLSNDALAKEPLAGDVFVYQTNVTGLPENQYVKYDL